MKNKIQSYVGMRLGGRRLIDTLTTHLSPTNHPLKHGVGKYIFSFLLVLTMSIGQMWGAYAPENNPATKTYGEITFLDVANTKANGKITKTGATFEGDSTLAYSLRYVGQTLAVTTWYNCSDGSPASNFESSPTYADAEINGFVAPSSSSGNIGYGGAKAHSGRVRYFYATGITSVAIISHDNGSSKYVQLKIEEVASDGTLSAVTTIDSPNKSSSTLSLIEYTTSLDPSKYYKISCTSNNSSNCKVYQIRFGKYIAPAASHTVTYLPGAGSGPDYIIDDDATTVSGCPAEFSYTGYDFVGWKDALNNDVAVGATVTSDMTLTAQWTVHVAKYTVKYMDGTTEVGSETVEVGQHPTGSAISAPTKDCYTFAGWDPALSGVSGSDGDEIEVDATWTPVYSSSATLISDANVSAKANVNTIFAASNIVSSITFTSGNYEFTSNETKPGYYGYKDKNSGDYMKILLKQGKRAQVLFGNLGADPTITVNGVAKSLDAARATGDMAENTFTWTAAEDALIVITMGSGTNTLKKVDIVQLYTATRVDGKSDGAGTDANVLETTLPTPTAISGWTFTGWTANEDVKAGEDTKTAGTVLAAGTYTLLANTTFTAQWAEASSTYDITYVSAHGTAPDAENAASVVLAELSADGWAHKGWTANADVTVDAATVEAGTLIANGKTAILASDVEFTAVWKEVFTVSFNSKDGSAVAPIDVEDGASLAAAPANPTKDNYVFLGWSETDGGDVVADITAITISADKTFFAKWALDVQVSEIVFSNSFKGWINGSTVEVFYMAGESAPTIVSYAGKNLKAEGGVVISGDKIIATGTDDSEIEFALTMTEVTPLTASGSQTFDGSEGYVKTRHAWTSDKKWKMSKYATDGRVARGETSLYIFLGAAESVTLDWGAQKVTDDVAVYVNGTFVKNVGKNNNSAIELSNGNNMVALYSLQTSGDIWLNGLTVAPWVPVTAVTLKEGEDPISSKEIWESTSFTLTAEVTPDNASNKTITWTSSNDAIATVVNGVVTGVAANASPVTITASTVDGVTATCEVTVTATPEPSAAPVITTQPADGNYYEETTIAALEVVATGESLSYQWYLGSDAIDGAIAATYTPTVSAIGSYVYHCVVTNTEAGKLPTSLASDNATITIAEDPAAIKLLDSEGEINTTYFTTGVSKGTVTISEVSHNCASFGSTGGSIVGLTGLNKVVAYNATTTQTKVKFILYNENSSPKEMYLQKVLEGATEAVTETIAVPSKEYHETQYYEYNSSDLRSFYVTVNSTNIKILQVKVIDNGTALKRAGEAGYELNLNLGRVFGAQNTATAFEGLAFEPSSNAKVLNSTELQITKPLSFTIASPLTLAVTTSTAKYYVSQNAEEDGTTATAITAAGTEEFDLTAIGTWYIVPSTSSAVKLTNIAFAAPKCAEPAFNALANSEICDGDAYVALDGTGTVSDGGTIDYKWYAHGADESDPAAILATTATYTPTADGTYYVKALHHVDGFTDNEATSDEVTVTTHAGTVINEAPVNQRAVAGEYATLTVDASGKNLSYTWYACSNEAGDNAMEIYSSGASLQILVTSGLSQWYKVVVHSDCGADLSATAKIEEFVPVAQANVEGPIVWDWTEAASVNEIKLTASTTPKKNEGFVMANGAATIYNNANFESDKLYLEGEYIVRDGKYFQGQTIKFNATIAGGIRVKFSNTGGNPARELYINGVGTGITSANGTLIWSDYIEVPVGEVSITAYLADKSEDASQKYIRVSEIEFLELAHQRTSGYKAGDLGTVCLEDATIIDGANLYELAGLDQYGYLAFDQITTGELEAGTPYLFEVTNPSKVSFYKPVGAAHSDTEIETNGMIGTFTGTTLYQNVAENYYYFSGRHIWRVNDFTVSIPVPAHRCYVDMDELQPVAAPLPMPGRKRVAIGVNGAPQVTTGIDNAEAISAPRKMMINGKLFILRGEKTFDATGRLVK